MDESRSEQFCCQGCALAYEVIRGAGLGRFYELKAIANQNASTPITPGPINDGEEFDDPVFQAAHCRPGPGGTMSCDLVVSGIHCGACAWLIERLPRLLPGVVEARVNLPKRLVCVVWQPAAVRLSAVARALSSLGYAPRPATSEARRSIQREEQRAWLIRLGVAGACAGNVMVISFGLYGGMFTGIEAAHELTLRIVSMGFGLVALLWPGAMFFQGAFRALRAKTLSMDVPIALALGAGGLSGAINTVLSRSEVYWDTVTMLVFLLLIGRWLQHRQQRSAEDVVEHLSRLTPSSATRLTPSGPQRISTESIKIDDLLLIGAGERVPADGIIASGRSVLDSSLLTGESRPESVGKEDMIFAGSINLSAPIELRVTASKDATRLAGIGRLVEQADQLRAPVARLADRLASVFVAGVLVLAGLTLSVWLWLNPAVAIDHTISLLIVTCPCALALATPLAVSSAIGRAARQGILIKSGAALELLARSGTMLLDKTGTLTQGSMRLARWEGDELAMRMLAAAESNASHPIAQAVRLQFDMEGASVESFTQSVGSGIIAQVDGVKVVAGTLRHLQSENISVDPTWIQIMDEMHNQCFSTVLVAVDDKVSAIAGFGDPLRHGAKSTIDTLRQRGWLVGIVSGDAEAIVEQVGAALGIDRSMRIAGASPEEKMARVQSHQTPRPIVMVGDGVNDAAALAGADVGIAVRGGAEASLSAADVYISKGGLEPLVVLVEGARRTLRVIRINFAISLAYNAVCAGLAVAGRIDPLIAAILMPLSSLTVISLSYRLRTFRQIEVES